MQFRRGKAASTARRRKRILSKPPCSGADKAGLSDVKIIIWDHNKEQLYDRAKVTLADEDVRRRVTGIGMHWYSGEHFEAVGITKQAFPEKQLLVTEFCHGLYAKERAGDYGGTVCV